MFICNSPDQEGATRRSFEEEGITIDVVPGSRYHIAYLVPQEEREAWVRHQVEKWAAVVWSLAKFIV